MFDIGFTELLLFAVIALIVLGPEKLPQAVRTAGKYYAKFRRTVTTIQAEMEAELDLAETRQKMQEELAKIKQAEAQMKQEMAQLRGSIKQFEQSQEASLTANSSTASNQQASASILATPNDAHAQTDTSEANSLNSSNADTSNLDNPNLDTSNQVNPATLMSTRPWENMWFRLGDYDKARRLPRAPYIPNYQLDPLLNAPATTSSADMTVGGQ